MSPIFADFDARRKPLDMGTLNIIIITLIVLEILETSRVNSDM